jgi:hypothetical protein
LGLQLFDWRKAIEAAPAVADLLARELGWARDRCDEAVASYTGMIRGFLAVLGLPERAAA